MEAWRSVLVAALALNAALGFGYRVYRLTKGGPLGDAVGQGALGILLGALAGAIAAGAGWARWAALVYGLLFAVIVMPLWVLAVLIPMRPGAVDYGFTVAYWLGLAATVVAAVAL